MKNELESTYNIILEINLQINSMLNEFPKEDFESFNEKLQDYINQKDIYVQKLLSLKENYGEKLKNFLKETDLKEISEQVNNLEQENLKLIQEKKEYLSKEINKTNKAAKAFSAYKFDKRNEPQIFDETD